MTNGLVLFIEVGLIALLLVLAFRMLTLVRNDPFVPATSVAFADSAPQSVTVQAANRLSSAQGAVGHGLDKCELITRLHILLSIQERDCREKGLELETAPNAVKEYVAAWLYGAACSLCDKSQRHSDALVSLVSQLASRKIGLRQPEAVQVLSTLTASSTWLACFRNGMEGADYWSEHRHIPQAYSLYGAITSNAFI
ncbi:hypothetical protein [Marinobacter sp. HL-58]|uniref:hypothetical protein n=1 Tax=Marinobacter sp. HL-58 TaxID=1479237 RepID=UPI00047F4B72|nr:hypothetical protein [Marinobacter sp. HL-58]KPQ01545.1 MAG: hypothetical protein HLUCCO03_12300 [Marinobacter sp. HL-58]